MLESNWRQNRRPGRLASFPAPPRVVPAPNCRSKRSPISQTKVNGNVNGNVVTIVGNTLIFNWIIRGIVEYIYRVLPPVLVLALVSPPSVEHISGLLDGLALPQSCSEIPHFAKKLILLCISHNYLWLCQLFP